ncbi:nucleotide sugar dehydrogenase [Rhodoplanes serenus]|uniref:nucleotide sugar dehydrogenase n=1 Tax=Rhodoplanes serenus TaxID=200615 RepID=UPI000DACE90B|nr:nucleotide sugar dehydrogenase [Rhodoplanes serenus]RAI33224.1 UDP-N-acetyl-D-glucosamine dehydrogenase [Rhodoplanes serenus]
MNEAQSSRGPTEHYVQLQAKIADRNAVVAVCGLGYVGLPLARAICAADYKVLGLDIDDTKVAKLNAGRTYIRHISAAAITAMVDTGRFSASSDFRGVAGADIVLICVPTPLTRHREPDLSFVVATARSVAEFARPGQIVVLESTTYPGTTMEVLAPLFSARGLDLDGEFFLGFSPEREDPGNLDYETTTIPKVIGGHGEHATKLIAAFYGSFVETVVPVSSPGIAEAVKLTENIFRAVNIALVNELKVVYGEMGLDIWEIIEAAKTKPFGFMPFYPGPGLGGHCIPIDPFYLTWKAREYDVTARFIELAGQINTNMPHLVVSRLAQALDQRFQKGLSGTRVLIVGIAYKKNVDDMRESPALKLIELIENRGASVDYFDPFIPEITMTREHAALAGRRTIDFSAETLSGYDAAVVVADHDAIDYVTLVESSKLVVDTRNVCARNNVESHKVVKA